MKPCARLLTLLLAWVPHHASACTLWAAVGPDAGGGTLVAKNRDWKPDHTQRLRQVLPKNGYAYFGLFAAGNDHAGLKDGVNSQGLVVVNAAASSLPRTLREQQPDKTGTVGRILAHHASVDSVVAAADSLFGTARVNHFLIADRSKVLLVEVDLNGAYRLRAVDHGVTAHTNHYLSPDLAATANQKTGKSSATRLARVNALLDHAPRPFSIAQFATISRDRNDGPDNSLWRSGKEHTMASWIIATPPAGPQTLQVTLNNPGQPETTQTFVLDDAFWNGAAARKPLPARGADRSSGMPP